MENIEVALVGVITLFIGLIQALRSAYSANVDDAKSYGKKVLILERRLLKYKSFITQLQLKILDLKEDNIDLRNENARIIKLLLDNDIEIGYTVRNIKKEGGFDHHTGNRLTRKEGTRPPAEQKQGDDKLPSRRSRKDS